MDLTQLVTTNQFIKIVPSLEESLQAIGLNVHLDENVKIWFNKLIITWTTWKKSPTVEHHFDVFYETIPDPYRVVLIFIIRCKEFKDCKPKTFPFFILETLQKWSRKSGLLPEDNLKFPAFRIATEQRNQNFLSMILKTYRVETIKEIILPIVKDMIKNDNCKQASQIVIAMGLFEDIPVENLLFPLILQDKPNMIDEYLYECPNQVVPLLHFLDKLLDRKCSIREFAQKYIEENNVCHIKYEKLHYKPLGKLVARLCNKFNVPIELCKNLSKNRTLGGLKYLINQKYIDQKVSSTVWDDLVKDSLKQNAESAKEFIDMLLEYDRKEALKWVEYLKLPESQFPIALQQMSLEDHISETENWDTTEDAQQYYKFPLPLDNIIIIDTAEKFYDLINIQLVSCNLISIDCEWKPSFGATQSHVALIQIATENYVYLIDSLVLNKQQYVSFWYTFNKSILNNAEIIKLGFGIENDLKEIKTSVVGLSNIKVKGEGLLDLAVLWKNIINCGLSLHNNGTNVGNSLSSLVQACFGLPLGKSEQCSNWEIRPLRNTQIQYAALDAYILIEIYNFLQKQCLEQKIDFEDICNDVMLDKKKKCSKKIKSLDKLQGVAVCPQARCVSDVKLFVESEISNLIPYLRYCGIDTMIMPTKLWCDVINEAISDERFIVLNKLKYTPNNTYSQSSILNVGNGSETDQLKKIFCCFNINARKNDLSSRCMNCNDLDIKMLTPQEVVDLCTKYQSCHSSNYNKSNYINDSNDDDEAYYDNFLSDSDIDEDIIYRPVQTQHPPHTSCLTSKGVPIKIPNVHKLSVSPQTAIICESCGSLFCNDDDLMKSVSNLVLTLTKISV